jgi:hypothetical protein
MHALDQQIRELSDRAYGEIYGRFGTDEERDAFFRHVWKRALREDARKRQQDLKRFRRQIDQLGDAATTIKSDINRIRRESTETREFLRRAKAFVEKVGVSQSEDDANGQQIE